MRALKAEWELVVQAEGTACVEGVPGEPGDSGGHSMLCWKGKGTWATSEPATLVRVASARRGWWEVILDPHAQHSLCAGGQGRADPLSPGKGEWAPPPAHLTDPCTLQTTYKGKSSFQTYSDYLRWESFLQQQLQTFPEGSALHRGFQTCEHWKQIFMEIIGK